MQLRHQKEEMQEMKWYYLYEGDISRAYALSGSIQKQALALSILGNNVAVFSRLDRKTGGTHFYLTPGMESVANTLGFKRADKPSHIEAGGILFSNDASFDWLN